MEFKRLKELAGMEIINDEQLDEADNSHAVVFIPVSDMESYADWDDAVGYGGQDQLSYNNGIVVKKEDEQKFRGHVSKFEKNNSKFEKK